MDLKKKKKIYKNFALYDILDKNNRKKIVRTKTQKLKARDTLSREYNFLVYKIFE